ncbi:MAG: DUF4118 domain-containing protein [Chloroflexi bacterium]|nr:DUF4118 domain-containing protein [Chloroflexota bacterium]
MTKGLSTRIVRLSPWQGYVLSFGLVGLVTLLGLATHVFFDVTNIAMAYLLAVVVASALGGPGPSILACLFSVAILNFVFVPPIMSFGPPDTRYVFTLLVFLVVGMTTSSLTSRIRNQTEAAKRREHETATLYDLSRKLANSTRIDDMILSVVSSAKRMLGEEVIVFLPNPQDSEKPRIYTDKPNYMVSQLDVEGAVRLFRDDSISERALVPPYSGTRYLRLVSAQKTVGVMAVFSDARLADDQERLMEAFADLAAVYIERAQLAEDARDTEIVKAKEKLQTALLSSISHDLRTPLVSVIGVLSSLQEDKVGIDDATKNMAQVALEESERLNRLVSNLLSMSRIEAGATKILRQDSDVRDLIDSALEQLTRESSDRPINLSIPDEMPLINVDFGLIVQTLVNIMDNAFRYSPPGSPIDVNVKQIGGEVHIEVADRGIGIPQEDMARVFDKFYRAHNTNSVAGTGLGLSICKGIVEAHGGSVTAQNRPGGGSTLKIMLPVNRS